MILAEPESEERLRELRDSDEPADRSTFWPLAGRLIPTELAARVEPEIRLCVIDHSDRRLREPGDLEPVDVDYSSPAPAYSPAPVVDLVAPSAALPPSLAQPPIPPPSPPAVMISRPWEYEARLQDSADLD